MSCILYHGADFAARASLGVFDTYCEEFRVTINERVRSNEIINDLLCKECVRPLTFRTERDKHELSA